MRNITVALDDEIARWARVAAAERDLSVSRFIAQLLRDQMQRQVEYEEAMRSALSRDPVALKRPGQPYPARDALHDRSGLR